MRKIQTQQQQQVSLLLLLLHPATAADAGRSRMMLRCISTSIVQLSHCPMSACVDLHRAGWQTGATCYVHIRRPTAVSSLCEWVRGIAVCRRCSSCESMRAIACMFSFLLLPRDAVHSATIPSQIAFAGERITVSSWERFVPYSQFEFMSRGPTFSLFLTCIHGFLYTA